LPTGNTKGSVLHKSLYYNLCSCSVLIPTMNCTVLLMCPVHKFHISYLILLPKVCNVLLLHIDKNCRAKQIHLHLPPLVIFLLSFFLQFYIFIYNQSNFKFLLP
jgi:hypothetical protein